MIFHKQALSGAYLIDLEPHSDERGFFARMLCKREFAEHGLNMDIVQSNVNYSALEGTLRGLHLQLPPHQEEKIVRCTRGAVYDVIVDLRPESPTYLEWEGAELSAENRRMVYVPKGCAHGFLTLTDDSEVRYAVTAAYAPDAESGLRYDDPAIGIEWPRPVRIISEKDKEWPLYDPSSTLTEKP